MAETKPQSAAQSGEGIVEFLRGVQSEMKKVAWPNRKELVSYTIVVAVAVFIVCTLVWICDAFFARLFELILK